MNRSILSPRLLASLFLFAALSPARAQLAERVYATDHHIPAGRKGELRVEIDNINFFKDNEYAGSTMAGYSLPGLWLQPRLAYYPLDNIKLEAGVHLLKYWGATKYPNMAYRDIADWQGRQYQHGVHILPFFRAQVALTEHLDIVLGNLYGGANHQLIDPLYTPELNLTADPEAGLQLLYQSRRFDLDAWVNWQSFIFRDDVHQEAFTVGLSSRLKLGRADAPVRFYIPLQGLIQHRGGEIDTIFSSSVQTLMNGAIGVGATWHPGRRWLREAGAEIDALGYYQQAGHLWPYGSGTAFYAKAWADVSDFRIKAGYFAGDKFISMYGLPFYGAVSTKEPGLVFRHPRTGYLGLEYAYRFSPGYAIGAEVEIYYRFAGDGLRPLAADPSLAAAGRGGEGEAAAPAEEVVRLKGATSFSAGVYLRICPSFLIKRFGEK